MGTRIAVIACLVLVSSLIWPTAAQIIYVDADATGADSGTSWTDAYTDLQSGLDDAVPGTQIWIAEGSYKPHVLVGGGDHRHATFVLPDGIELLGGFAGGESQAGQADPDTRPTVLSGDLGVQDDAADNAYHVVTLIGTGPDTSMDGLIITGGNAIGPGFDDKRGGGLRLFEASLTMTRCTVRENVGQVGSGLWSEGDGDSLVVDRSSFESNSLDRALLVYNGSSSSEGSAVVSDSEFLGNTAGGMDLGSFMTGTVARCSFVGNDDVGDTGGGLSVSDRASFLVSDSTFRGNSTTITGGGMHVFLQQDDGRSRRIRRTTFQDNVADSDGGGLNLQGDFTGVPDGCGEPEVLVDECVFIGNTSGSDGGGLQITWACPRIVNGTFLGNSADRGGAIAIPDTTNLEFESEESSPFIVNTLISGNTAEQGGGIHVHGAHDPYLLNCTVAHNEASGDGGGLWVSSANIVGFAEPRIVNSLLWGNVDAGGSDESAQYHSGQSSPLVNYTLVQGWTGTLGGGVGSGGADPAFTDPDGVDNVFGTRDDDLTVQSGSPAIDSGNNDPHLVPWAVTDVADLDCDDDLAEPIALDRARVRRFADDPAVADTGFGKAPIIDRGAYERGAWRNLGADLIGTHGRPCLVGDGNLVSGNATELALSNTLEFATSGLFLGLTEANLSPFFGGTLVPSPDVLILVPTGATGGWTAAGAFPSGVPPGFTFWAHVWVEDPAAAFGLAGSNAVSATAP